MADVTRILQSIEQGHLQASQELLPLVYEELRILAGQRMAHEKPGQTLSATSLVHEAYLRLVDVEESQKWNGRGHFFAAAAEAMRRILVENARAKKSAKRGGDWQRIELAGLAVAIETQPDRLLDLNEALDSLETNDDEAAQIAKMRLFAGMTLDELALSLGLSRTVVHRQWTYARAWLKRELSEDSVSDDF
jgi:RNA polymerase sigma factor (TIGR02999 family)